MQSCRGQLRNVVLPPPQSTHNGVIHWIILQLHTGRDVLQNAVIKPFFGCHCSAIRSEPSNHLVRHSWNVCRHRVCDNSAALIPAAENTNYMGQYRADT